jgi:hypothetical protein
MNLRALADFNLAFVVAVIDKLMTRFELALAAIGIMMAYFLLLDKPSALGDLRQFLASEKYYLFLLLLLLAFSVFTNWLQFTLYKAHLSELNRLNNELASEITRNNQPRQMEKTQTLP